MSRTYAASSLPRIDDIYNVRIDRETRQLLSDLMAKRGAHTVADAISVALYDAALLADLTSQGAKIFADLPPLGFGLRRRVHLQFPIHSHDG